MKNTLLITTIFFVSIACAMSSYDTQLMPYFPAHTRTVRLANSEDRTDDTQMPEFFYHELILATCLQKSCTPIRQEWMAIAPEEFATHEPTPAEIATLAAFYQETHSLPDGTIRHDDGSVSSGVDFEQAIEQTLQEAAAIKQQKENLAHQDSVQTIDQQQQEVAQGKDRVSRVLTITQIPLLLTGGAITAASIMRTTARKPKTRFISLTALTELPKAVYAIMLVGVTAKYIWGAVYNQWLTWSRNHALNVVKQLQPRIEALEQAEGQKDRELEQLRSALAAHQKKELEVRSQQDQAIQTMTTALQVQLDKLKQQLTEETQTGELSHQQLQRDLTDMQESLNGLRASGQRQTDILSKIQIACAHVEAAAHMFKKK